MRFFKRWGKRREVGELQLRIDNCRSTIAEVHGAMVMDEVQPQIAGQFRRLAAALEQVDVQQLRKGDLEEIETATNNLLEEFRSLYRQGKLKSIYEGLLH